MMCDVLGQLDILIADLPDGNPTSEQLDKLYDVYLNSFVNQQYIHKGQRVFVNTTIVRQASKYGPLLVGKQDSFGHIISRNDDKKKRRDYDKERANRIHWIIPILENEKDPRIKRFIRNDDKGQPCKFLWFEEKSYIVILKVIIPGYFLLTAFCVDDDEAIKFEKWFQESQ